MKSKKFFYITAFIIVILILLGASYLAVSHYIHKVPSVSKDIIVEIPKGAGLKEISSKLKGSGVIKSDKLFILYVMSEGWQDTLKAGEYEFDKGSTMSDVAGKIVTGDVLLYRVTIPEGLTVKEIAGLLNKKGVVEEQEFILETENKELLRELLGHGAISFEGYLFPETYSYSRSPKSQELIRLMVGRFKAVYEPLQDIGDMVSLTDNEIMTLASIIEKETGAAFERPMISAVFHNRLRIGMKLDSDPTVIYGMGESYNGNLRRRDLREVTEYNTYVIK